MADSESQTLHITGAAGYAVTTTALRRHLADEGRDPNGPYTGDDIRATFEKEEVRRRAIASGIDWQPR